MAESLIITADTKEQMYLELIPQLKALVAPEEDLIANLANITAALTQAFNWLWVGFYLVKPPVLVLGPFQGPVACTRIAYGRGVCGVCWEKKQLMLVPDVNQFPGHIACSSLSQSEIVVPLLDKSGNCVGVLDVDSDELHHFDQIDAVYLTEIANLLCV